VSIADMWRKCKAVHQHLLPRLLSGHLRIQLGALRVWIAAVLVDLQVQVPAVLVDLQVQVPAVLVDLQVQVPAVLVDLQV